MSSSREPLAAAWPRCWHSSAVLAPRAGAEPRPSSGHRPRRHASEIAAWDIDVRPDFKGLPKGSGSVAQGMDVWEAQCASCHGVFGESNEVFTPLVGGTTKEDVKTGRVGAPERPRPSRRAPR